MNQTFTFRGQIKAETPLTVSRPGDNFASIGQSKSLSRLPRAGAKRVDTPIYFPTSSLNGKIRRSTLDVLRRHLIEATNTEHPFDVDTFYMLVQSVDTTQKLNQEIKTSGRVEEELELRLANPFLSLFGRWGLPGRWAIGDAIPDGSDDQSNIMYVTGNGARVNEWARNPEQITFLDSDNRKRLQKILVDDSLAAKDIVVQKEEVAALKKSLRSAATAEEKASIQDTVSRLENEIELAKTAKEGSSESIQRPLEGYECIAPGTVMDHRMVAQNVTAFELGMMIFGLAEFSRDPRVGGHLRQGAGEISAFWDVKIRPVDTWESVTVGRVQLSSDRFSVEDLTDDKFLSKACEAFKNAMKDPLTAGLDFTRFLKDAS